MIEKSYFIPNNYNVFIVAIKLKKFLIANGNLYSFIIKINIKSYYNFINNIICISTTNTNFNVYNNIFYLLTNVYIINIKTIKFLGKGFRFTKNENDLIFLFQHSHMYEFINIKLFMKKIKKNRVWISYMDVNYLKNILSKIISIRPVMFYTKNGLRTKRQIIFKRKGKTIMT